MTSLRNPSDSPVSVLLQLGVHVLAEAVLWRRVGAFDAGRVSLLEHGFYGQVAQPRMLLEVFLRFQLVFEHSFEVAHLVTGGRCRTVLLPDSRRTIF